MSLAGTQVFVDHKVVWKNKELEEQQLVTNFIEDQFPKAKKAIIKTNNNKNEQCN